MDVYSLTAANLPRRRPAPMDARTEQRYYAGQSRLPWLPGLRPSFGTLRVAALFCLVLLAGCLPR